MFGAKNPPNGKKPNSVDVLLKKLAALPPAIDLFIASVVGGYSLVAIFVNGAKFIGLICILTSLLFAMMGINAIIREMKAFKQIESNSTSDDLRSMKRRQIEQYLTALFSLDGYRVRSAIGELDRFDDVDLIAVKKKEVLFIQFNHFDEDVVDVKPVQSLQKASTALAATRCIAITFGNFSANATDWARRKDVNLLNIEDIISTAHRLTGVPLKEVIPEKKYQVDVVRQAPRFLFVDFAGLDHHGLIHLLDVIRQHQTYQVIASTLPSEKDIDAIRDELQECGNRLIDKIGTIPEGRYFAIQKHLSAIPDGKHAIWLAIDANPHEFPEGGFELVAVNRTFGFDVSASRRLIDAMTMVERQSSMIDRNMNSCR